MTFGEWLRQSRQKANLTMQELATKAGVSHAHISKVEGGKGKAHIDTVVALADALGVDRRAALLAFISEVSPEPDGEWTHRIELGEGIALTVSGRGDTPADVGEEAAQFLEVYFAAKKKREQAN